jgi:membrane protease YdiL (CAAX protease family)
MKQFFADYWKTLLVFAVIGLVGGYFVGLYQLDSFPAEIQQSAYDQGVTRSMLGAVSAIQSALLGFVLGALGIFLAKKTGLWKDERTLTKKPLILSLLIGLAGGLVMILSDLLFFGHYSQAIMDSYAVKPGIPLLIAMVTYGAVIEEVMLRLFCMSLFAFLLYKLFGKKGEKPATAIFVAANILSALLFAAGHLPLTFTLLGNAPLIIFRCFLLNGGLGLLFGFLYRKYGLRYAMIAHGCCHVVSKLIWILFV